MSDTRLIEEVRRYPPDVVFPYPWRVEISPQVNDTTAWSVLDADGTEIFTVHDEEVANALAAVPQFIARIEELEREIRTATDRAEECEVYRNELATSDAWYAKRAELDARIDALEEALRRAPFYHSPRCSSVQPTASPNCDCGVYEAVQHIVSLGIEWIGAVT